jgi:hypothetical protein
MIDLPAWAVSGLVELRWLQPLRRNERAAVIDAFYRFVEYALDMTRNTGQ